MGWTCRPKYADSRSYSLSLYSQLKLSTQVALFELPSKLNEALVFGRSVRLGDDVRVSQSYCRGRYYDAY
jgi:hypothetical protein